jgi:hypothetical protein
LHAPLESPPRTLRGRSPERRMYSDSRAYASGTRLYAALTVRPAATIPGLFITPIRGQIQLHCVSTAAHHPRHDTEHESLRPRLRQYGGAGVPLSPDVPRARQGTSNIFSSIRDSTNRQRLHQNLAYLTQLVGIFRAAEQWPLTWCLRIRASSVFVNLDLGLQ